MGAKVEHCPHCDEALPVVRDAYCPACRSALDDEPAGEGATPPAGQASSPDGSEGEIRRERVVSAVILCFVAGFGCLWLNESQERPDPVLEWMGLALCAPLVAFIVFEWVVIVLAVVVLLFSRRKAS